MALMIMEHTNIVKLHEVFFHVNGELIGQSTIALCLLES
jgi:hypothetical protein